MAGGSGCAWVGPLDGHGGFIFTCTKATMRSRQSDTVRGPKNYHDVRGANGSLRSLTRGSGRGPSPLHAHRPQQHVRALLRLVHWKYKINNTTTQATTQAAPMSTGSTGAGFVGFFGFSLGTRLPQKNWVSASSQLWLKSCGMCFAVHT